MAGKASTIDVEAAWTERRYRKQPAGNRRDLLELDELVLVSQLPVKDISGEQRLDGRLPFAFNT